MRNMVVKTVYLTPEGMEKSQVLYSTNLEPKEVDEYLEMRVSGHLRQGWEQVEKYKLVKGSESVEFTAEVARWPS